MKNFTQTSHEPYDRHYYVLHLAGGGHSVWEDYEELRDHWFLDHGWGMSHIEVKDRQSLKQKSKGFR
jgi:hypothetical protein